MQRAMKTAFAFLGVMASMVIAGCAHWPSTAASGAGGSESPEPPQTVATMRASGSMHLALTLPARTTLDLAANCALDSLDERGGGLRVLGQTPQASVAVIGPSVGRDGDLSWNPDGTSPLTEPPIEVDIALGKTSIFTSSAGSSTTLHTADGGRTGVATFGNATYVADGSIAAASGTVTWSCT
jgi:hypothetical protein